MSTQERGHASRPVSQYVAQHEGVEPQARGRRVHVGPADEPYAVREAGDLEQAGRVFHVADRPLQFEVIPLVCTVADVCHFLRLSKTQLYRLLAKKALVLVELDPFDSSRRFSGESVAREIKLRCQRKVA